MTSDFPTESHIRISIAKIFEFKLSNHANKLHSSVVEFLFRREILKIVSHLTEIKISIVFREIGGKTSHIIPSHQT